MGCGLTAAHTVICWEGINDAGTMRLETMPGKYLSFDAWGDCGIQLQGTVACWHDNLPRPPRPAYAPAGRFLQWKGSCGLSETGRIICIMNRQGVDPLAGARYVRVSIFGDPDWAGPMVICGLRQDGSFVCSRNDGSYVSSDTISGPTARYRQVDAGGGGSSSCALTERGVLRCWPEISGTPSGLFSQVALYGSQACAIHKPSGRMVCWGDADDHDLGIPAAGAFKQVSVTPSDFSAVCALTVRGGAMCWLPPSPDFPPLRPPVGRFTQIVTGWGFACALSDRDSVRCWGQRPKGPAE